MDTAAAFLARVETQASSALTGGALLSKAATHLVCAKEAKRVRPRLVYQAAQVAGVALDSDALVDIATAIELMHSASLLHDDVVDDGQLRRGVPTVNKQFGNTVAVLSGDLVLSRALALLGIHAPASLLSCSVAVVEEMTIAAHREVLARYDHGFALTDWRTMAEGKSGALFGLCGRLVCLLAQNPDLADRFDRAGRHLGVAFQIADDVADFLPNRGEEPYQDLRCGNPSFPVLFALAKTPALHKLFADTQDVTLLGQAIANGDALVRSLNAVAFEVESAKQALAEDRWHPALRPVWQWAESLT